MKETGLGWTTLDVDDAAGTPRGLRSPTTNLDFATPYNTQVVTGLDKSAEERLALLADFTGTLNSVFDPGANSMHDVMSGDLRVSRTMTLVISGQSLVNQVLFTDYNLTRAASGEFTAQHPFVLSDGTVPAWT